MQKREGQPPECPTLSFSGQEYLHALQRTPFNSPLGVGLLSTSGEAVFQVHGVRWVGKGWKRGLGLDGELETLKGLFPNGSTFTSKVITWATR